jgi:hypothetical protein
MEAFMLSYRCALALFLSSLLILWQPPPVFASLSPLGVLTQATHAFLDEAVASPGLSVFNGERLSTEAGGQVALRAGATTLALLAKSDVTLFQTGDGLHVDMTAGSVQFFAAENECVEVHVEEALLRPDSTGPTQARITVFAPKVLQVVTVRGGLNFSYREEFRNLPERQTYRIYLDAPAEPQIAAGSGGAKSSIVGKVAYFIVGAGIGSLAGWKIRDNNSSGTAPESPWKP